MWGRKWRKELLEDLGVGKDTSLSCPGSSTCLRALWQPHNRAVCWVCDWMSWYLLAKCYCPQRSHWRGRTKCKIWRGLPCIEFITYILTSIVAFATSVMYTMADSFRWVRSSAFAYRAPLLYTPGSAAGRPRFHITQEQLLYLRSLSFSWSDISRLLGISRMSLYSRRAEFGMLSEPSQSTSDHNLVQVVEELWRELPDIGQSIVAGRLRALGIQAPRQQIREAIQRTDPLNTALRWRGATTRRPYSAPGTNSLWHIGTYFYICSISIATWGNSHLTIYT